MKNDLLGQKVANDGLGLKKALEAHYQVEKLEHVGNFVFKADLADRYPLLIVTRPVDMAAQTLCITRICDVGGKSK